MMVAAQWTGTVGEGSPSHLALMPVLLRNKPTERKPEPDHMPLDQLYHLIDLESEGIRGW